MQIGQQTPAHLGWQRPQADQHYHRYHQTSPSTAPATRLPTPKPHTRLAK